MGAHDKHSKDKRSPIALDVQRAVSMLFARAEQADVIAAMKRCRPGRDVARVHRAILDMSCRSVREVERLVEIANEERGGIDPFG